MNSTNTKLYIANLGKYNEGELVGEWIDLPFSEKDFQTMLCRIKLGRMIDDEFQSGFCENDSVYEEYAIHDYETDLNIEISEYENVNELNELIEQVEDLEEYEINEVKAYIEATGENIKNGIEAQSDGKIQLYSNCGSLEDLAMHFVDEGLFGNPDEMGSLSNYIDYTTLGRDLGFDGYTETNYGVVYCD